MGVIGGFSCSNSIVVPTKWLNTTFGVNSAITNFNFYAI